MRENEKKVIVLDIFESMAEEEAKRENFRGILNFAKFSELQRMR